MQKLNESLQDIQQEQQEDQQNENVENQKNNENKSKDDDDEKQEEQFRGKVSSLQNDSINSIDGQMNEINFGTDGLRQSLLKNFVEIKNIAMSKILKTLSKSFEKVDIESLSQLGTIMQDNKEYLDKFLSQLKRHRKENMMSILMPLTNQLNYSIENSLNKYLEDLFKQLPTIIKEEKICIFNIFSDRQIANNLFYVIINEILPETFVKIERSITNEKNSYVLFEAYEIFRQGLIDLKEEMQDNEGSAIIMLTKIERQSIILFDKSINKFQELIQNTKFNIQRIASYQILKTYGEEINQILKKMESNKNYMNIADFGKIIQPFKQIVNSKLQKKSLQSSIFVLNVNNIIVENIQEFKQDCLYSDKIQSYLQHIDEINEKLYQFIVNGNYTELLKLGKIEYFGNKILENKYEENQQQISFINFDNIKTNPEEKETVKKFFIFLLNMTNEFAKKLIIRDLYLIHDGKGRNQIKNDLIDKFIMFYGVIFEDIIQYYQRIIENTQQNQENQNKYRDMQFNEQNKIVQQIAQHFNIQIQEFVKDTQEAVLITPDNMKNDLLQVSRML